MSNQPRQPTRLGAYILDRMADLGMRQQKDLADAAGLTQPNISKLIYNQSRPRPDTLSAVARALHVDPPRLMEFAYNLSAPPESEGTPLFAEIALLNEMLQPDSDLTPSAREHLWAIVRAAMAPHLGTMKHTG